VVAENAVITECCGDCRAGFRGGGSSGPCAERAPGEHMRACSIECRPEERRCWLCFNAMVVREQPAEPLLAGDLRRRPIRHSPRRAGAGQRLVPLRCVGRSVW
jgi:hypothetical protein